MVYQEPTLSSCHARAFMEWDERRIVDSTLWPELQRYGRVNVLVTLAAGVSTSSPNTRRALGRHFLAPDHVRAVKSPAAAESWAAGPDERLVTFYTHLSMIAGTVGPDGLAGLQSEAIVAAIGGVPSVAGVPARYAPAGDCLNPTWGLEALRIPALWAQGLTGRGVVVGHADTGVDDTHPALEGAVRAFVEIDAQGRIKPERRPFDSGTHGTHTAGTIVGRPTKAWCIGVAPGAELASAMVIEGGNAFARIMSGINWAVSQGVDIINLSLVLRSHPHRLIPVLMMLRERQILPVVAIGNDGAGTSSSPGNYREALSVGAVDRHRNVALFSSSQHLTSPERLVPDLLAPGVDIMSACPGGTFSSMDGTSAAAAHVSGVAALLKESKPDATIEEVGWAMLMSCRPPSQGAVRRSKHGVLDAFGALKRLLTI